MAKNFEALKHGIDTVSKADYINYMKMVCDSNPRVKNRQFHAVISAKGDSHSPRQLSEIGEAYLKSMGYGDNPYLIYFHADTDNNHVHMVSTRVDKNGNKVDDTYEKIRSQKAMQEILEQDPRFEVKTVVDHALTYFFSSKAQFKMLLEQQGFKITENDGQLNLIKYGYVQTSVDDAIIQKRIKDYQVPEARMRQLKAIFHKYKNGRELEDFKASLHQKFGIEILLHQSSKHQLAYGFTIIDHTKKQVLKGSQVMSIREMIPEDFKDYFISSLASIQSEIVSMLLAISSKDPDLIDSDQSKAISCPYCSDKRIKANGRLKGVQRYVCNGCGMNFSETTGKFWYNIKKKDKVNRYLFCLLSGYSIRKSAKETGISIQTSFDWRHKLLTSFGGVSAEEFQGILESDDLFFSYSEKGRRDLDRPARKRGAKASTAGISNEKVAVIASCDRSGNKDFKVATRGRIGKSDLDTVLQGKLAKVETLCSDSHRSYTAFAKGKEIAHKKFNATKGQRAVDKIYHVQNVNNMDMRLRKFMESFNGVATKYLQNYLNWFLVLEKIKNSTSKMATAAAIAFASNSAWMEFKNIVLNNMLFRT